MHVGSLPLQVLPAWHVLVADPDILYPVEHVYVAVSPGLSPVSVTWPLFGADKAGQSKSISNVR